MVGPVQLIVNPFNCRTKEDRKFQSRNSCFGPVVMKSLERLHETQMPQIMILRLVDYNFPSDATVADRRGDILL